VFSLLFPPPPFPSPFVPPVGRKGREGRRPFSPPSSLPPLLFSARFRPSLRHRSGREGAFPPPPPLFLSFPLRNRTGPQGSARPKTKNAKRIFFSPLHLPCLSFVLQRIDKLGKGPRAVLLPPIPPPPSQPLTPLSSSMFRGSCVLREIGEKKVSQGLQTPLIFTLPSPRRATQVPPQLAPGDGKTIDKDFFSFFSSLFPLLFSFLSQSILGFLARDLDQVIVEDSDLSPPPSPFFSPFLFFSLFLSGIAEEIERPAASPA